MEILASFAVKIVKYTTAPIGRQMGYIFSYKDNFQQLTNQLVELEGAKETIEHWVNVEKRNGRQIKAIVQNWLDKVDEITKMAKQLCEDPCHENVRCSTCSFPNLWQRHQLSSKAKKVAKNVTYVLGEGKFDRDKIGYLPAIGGVGSTSATSRFVDFESRMSKMNEIMQALVDPKVNILGVYGLGGVGKSTLVEQVARKAKNENLFDAVVMASVMQSPDIKRIQSEIADQLGLQFSEESVLGRAYRLRQRINMEKNILIILDDIWAVMKLEEIGIPYRGKIYMENKEMEPQDDHMGCKLLLISRNQDVLQQMETQKDFRLEVLSEQETWCLFGFMAGDVAKDANYQSIAIEVAKKCAGLPVLIVTVARALKRKGIIEWKDALCRLARVDNKELHEITYSALELSYNQLESDEVKALFLLCGAEGPSVAVEDLLKYVMGLCVFKPINSLKDARYRLHKLISALKASCLLLEDDKDAKLVRMHDIVHEVAISIASRDEYIFIRKEDSQLKEWPMEDLHKRCPQIILRKCSIPKLPQRLDCVELKFLHLDPTNNHSLQIPDSFFEGIGKLQVLDLTCISMSSLPTSLCSLTNLQTLFLRKCSLGDVASIGALKNLKILNLANSSMGELPSELVKLTNLRMLDMSNSRIAVIPHNIISSLTTLEELYLGDTSIKWEDGNSIKQSKNARLAELKQLPNLTALDIQIQDVWILPRDLMFDKLEKYKILIGDVWKWFDEYEASKTLKLKLPTSIHLEHGIKVLIKRVESLYMDEINGISNVLYELNAEGFPLLKHLHIQNNAKIQHIINSLEWNQAFDSFPNLKTMVLQNLSKLEKLCHGPLTVNSLSKLRVIKVKSCDQMKYLFSYSMVKRLSQLISVEVSECSSMQKVVFMENDSSLVDDGITDTIEFCGLQSLTLQKLPMLDGFCPSELATSISDPFFSAKVAFPNLGTLKLTSVNLNKIWDSDQLSATCGIQNLTHLIVEKCGKLKHLFSYSMIGSLSKLKQLEVRECHMMEEIIDPEEGRNNAFASKEVQFPSLEKITIRNMENLRTVWHCQFEGLKSMVIEKCAKLVYIFPSYMQRKFNSLETLTARYCDSVKEIFELHPNEIGCEKDATKLAKLTLFALPKLKQVWSMDSDKILDFSNLQAVEVAFCDNLEYLFPYPIATGLQKIEELHIRYCNNMKEIVACKEGRMEQTVPFVLNQLTALSLCGLDQLRGFYTGTYTLSCPSLKKIYVVGCEKLVLLKRECMNSRERHHRGEPCLSFAQSLFTVETIPTNLEAVSILNCKEASMALQGEFPRLLFRKLKSLQLSELEDKYVTVVDCFLQNAPGLEMLKVEYSSLKVIFRDKRFLGDDRQFKTSTRLKRLSLVQLPELQYICEEGCQLEDLETLYVENCSSLINLVPFSLAFVHLTTLEVNNCNGLINLITSTAARSLITLKTLRITNCSLLEDIVTDKGDVAKDEIAFSSLIVLELNSLPRLCNFCSTNCFIKFPLLSTVVVRGCPRMRIFSMEDTITPILHQVHVDDEEWRLEDNINGTIQKMFANKVAFRSFEHLNLSQFPELKDLWYGPSTHNMFKSLISLVVDKCDFLSHALFTSNLLQVLQNLKHLKVKDCDSIETVFDVKGMDDKEVLVKQTTQMLNLTLSGLPRLKHIWNKEAQDIISFRNLRAVKVDNCESLEYLFPLSLCQDLELLEELYIESCGVVEIFSEKEGFEECRFHFPQLTRMRLWSLSKLNSFYPGSLNLECPLLKDLDVYHCEALKIFDFCYSDFQHLHQVNKVDIPIQQALFSSEKVCTKLKKLALNSKDVMTLQNGQHQENLFDKIEVLCLRCFHETPVTFPIDFLQRFPNLKTLKVRCSSFHTLFKREQVGHCQSGTSVQVEKLVLWGLHRLEYIWNEDNQSDKLPQLKSSGIELMPSSFSFKSLIKLEVSYCKALFYLITSSMAKCLVQLREMRIIDCEMEYVVKINEEVAEEEITFENLKYLKLNSLSSFRSFCSGKCTLIFPSLMTLKVIGCPKMKIFSPGVLITPKLRAVRVGNGRKCWNGDLNTTIKQL